MPRPTRDKPNSLVSSAAQVTTKRRTGVPPGNGLQPWQNEAWEMLDAVGEMEFYREWYANAFSRVDLYIEREEADGSKVRIEDGLAKAALDALYGGETGQEQMMSSFGSLLAVPGEGWLVGIIDPAMTADAPDQWRVLDRSEIAEQPGKWIIDRGDGRQEKYADGSVEGIEAQAYVTRIWRPHPKQWVQAHSSVRSAIPILRELVGLDKKVSADIDSRLAGAGIFIYPTEATFSSPVPGEVAGDPAVDPLLTTLINTMTTAIQDRADASSVAPIVMRVPGNLIDKVKHLTFWSEFSGEVRGLREDSLKRLANSLDVPAEVLTGMADVNHWTGWLLDDAAIKMHVEPGVGIVTHGLTTKYLWPILQTAAGGVLTPEDRRYTIKADTSGLRQRPNHAAEAESGRASLTINDKAWARETGFEDSDLLDPASDEYRRKVLQQVAQGSNPVLAVAALAELGVALDPVLLSSLQSLTPGPGQAPGSGPAATPPALESRTPPEQATTAPVTAAAVPDDALRRAHLAALVLGCEGVVYRAMERAKNKAGKRRAGAATVIPLDRMDDCLMGAWDRLPRIAAVTGVDPTRLHAVLDTYTRAVLAEGVEYDPMVFSRMLERDLLGTLSG